MKTGLDTTLLLACSTLIGLAACGDDSSTTGAGGGGGDAASSTSQVASTSTTAQGPTSTSDGPSSSTDTSSVTGTGGDTGTATGTGGDGGAGTGTSSGDGGGFEVIPNDCEGPDDCPGGECVLVHGDFKSCKYPLQEATECVGEGDQCCDSADCDALGGGTCVTLPDASQCGGAQPEPYNVCSGDGACIDCAKGGGTCLDAGFFGYEQGQCVPQTCFADDDCGDEAGGRCVPVFVQCCGAIAGFYCSYPSDGCRDDAECGENRHCEGDPETGRAACADGAPLCPP